MTLDQKINSKSGFVIFLNILENEHRKISHSASPDINKMIEIEQMIRSYTKTYFNLLRESTQKKEPRHAQR